MHKGFKCLDPTEGHVYISHDVMFDERVFPFASLHPNAGAQLRSEIALLPESLLNPNASFGSAILHDQHLSSRVSTNPMRSSVHNMEDVRENLEENNSRPASSGRYFMCPW